MALLLSSHVEPWQYLASQRNGAQHWKPYGQERDGRKSHLQFQQSKTVRSLQFLACKI